MLYIEPKSLDSAFHFAAEEYVMSVLRPARPVFMLWRTERTVMVGANQIAEIEADLAYARESGIAVVRRSSGGGAIYTDPGTVLYTIILPYAGADTGAGLVDTKAVCADYLSEPVIAALGELGVAASLEGRNDILVGGKKIAGIAQYIKHGYLCSHGSLLFDADLGELTRVLTVNDEKIKSKALRSVRSRVTNIKEHLPRAAEAENGLRASARNDGLGFLKAGEPDTATFMRALRGHLFEVFAPAEYEFSESDLAGIEKLRTEKYGSDEWTFGRAPRYSFHSARRFAGGSVEIFADVKNGIIERVKITGDFLALRPISDVEYKFVGIPLRTDTIASALAGIDTSGYFGAITREELLSVFR
jgi:lipoate-protein ligase A